MFRGAWRPVSIIFWVVCPEPCFRVTVNKSKTSLTGGCEKALQELIGLGMNYIDLQLSIEYLALNSCMRSDWKRAQVYNFRSGELKSPGQRGQRVYMGRKIACRKVTKCSQYQNDIQRKI